MGKDIIIETDKFKIPSYLAEPNGEIKGGVIVIEEIWGLTDHIKDITNRFADEGYIAISPNILSETNIESIVNSETAKDLFNPEKRNAIQPQLREIMAPIQSPEFAESAKEKLLDTYNYLNKMPGAEDKIAVIGYCFGGSYSFQLAINEPRLKAALPYYGNSTYSLEEIEKIKCPVLAFYGEQDERLIAQLPELKEKMIKANINFESIVYPNCGHAFFNDTNPYAYNKEAALDAWNKTLEFITKNII